MLLFLLLEHGIAISQILRTPQRWFKARPQHLYRMRLTRCCVWLLRMWIMGDLSPTCFKVSSQLYGCLVDYLVTIAFTQGFHPITFRSYRSSQALMVAVLVVSNLLAGGGNNLCSVICANHGSTSTLVSVIHGTKMALSGLTVRVAYREDDVLSECKSLMLYWALVPGFLLPGVWYYRAELRERVSYAATHRRLTNCGCAETVCSVLILNCAVICIIVWLTVDLFASW